MKKYIIILFALATACFYSFPAVCAVTEVEFDTAQGSPIVYLGSSFIVPNIPETSNPESLIYIWPGVGPQGACYFPINNGVLQPVLTYGTGCAQKEPKNKSQWWISGQYINTEVNCKNVPSAFSTACPNYSANAHPLCQDVGNYMVVQPGQNLDTIIAYNAATQAWNQMINGSSKQAYSIKLNYCSINNAPTAVITKQSQEQNRAYLAIETYHYDPSITQVFNNIMLKANVGNNPSATCSGTFTMAKSPNVQTSCAPMNLVSNQGGILTCEISSCTVYKPDSSIKVPHRPAPVH